MILAQGTLVRSVDSIEVGVVERVLAVDEVDIFDGILIRTSDGQRFVDSDLVVAIHERVVLLSVEASAVPELPVHEGGKGAFDRRPAGGVAAGGLRPAYSAGGTLKVLIAWARPSGPASTTRPARGRRRRRRLEAPGPPARRKRARMMSAARRSRSRAAPSFPGR